MWAQAKAWASPLPQRTGRDYGLVMECQGATIEMNAPPHIKLIKKLKFDKINQILR